MREMVKMVLVLTILSSLSGGLLASLKNATKEKIEIQELELVKGPSIRKILDGSKNDPVSDRIKLISNEKEKSIFIGVFNDSADTIAFETEGKGFADKFGMIVAVNIKNDNIVGVGITTHKETPGLGANAKNDPKFANQFKGLNIVNTKLNIVSDGGQINALSGATITSRAVCAAVTEAGKEYIKIKPQLTDILKNFSSSGSLKNG